MATCTILTYSGFELGLQRQKARTSTTQASGRCFKYIMHKILSTQELIFLKTF